MADSLRDRLVAVLPLKPTYCPDPQCGDSTWDHECGDGPDRPNHELAGRVAAAVAGWLRAEAAKLRKRARAEKDPRAGVILAARVNTIEDLILQADNPNDRTED